MVELGIQVKLSARKVSGEEALKKISNVRVSLKVTAAIFFVLGVCETVLSVCEAVNDIMRTTADLAMKGTEEDPDTKQW